MGLAALLRVYLLLHLALSHSPASVQGAMEALQPTDHAQQPAPAGSAETVSDVEQGHSSTVPLRSEAGSAGLQALRGSQLTQLRSEDLDEKAHEPYRAQHDHTAEGEQLAVELNQVAIQNATSGRPPQQDRCSRQACVG